MDILVGDYEVYSSGSVIGIVGQPITFHIENLTYTFEFTTLPDQPQLSVRTDIVSKTHMKVTFINFDNTLGTGSIRPSKFGNLGDKELYFLYRINSLAPESGKLLNYTWLLSKKEKTEDNDTKENK